jgi:(p)ppGpp synthase/HD superfamily hydrolase
MKVSILRAIEFVTQRHGDHTRKNGMMVLSHVFSVWDLVAAHGGDETVQIAALLHDTVEAELAEYKEIEEHFGMKVASIVEEATEDFRKSDLLWRGRKQQFLITLVSVSEEAALVIAADKLHKAREHLARWKIYGVPESGIPPEDRLWYYGTTYLTLVSRNNKSAELRTLVAELGKVTAFMGELID